MRKRTKPTDPLVTKAREMRARGVSYGVIARVLKRTYQWVRLWTNARHREWRRKDTLSRWHARKEKRP